MVRFDAYTGTTRAAKPEDLLPILLCAPGDQVRLGPGYHLFGERLSVVDDSGDSVGSILYGGKQGDLVMVEVKGERSPGVVERLRQSFPHRCTRVDSCVDVERPGAFDALLGTVLQVKAKHRLWGNRDGDWDHPELGRTQYLGARTSAVRARLYEKGKEPALRSLERPDLVRLEVQVRPQKDAKTEYAQLSAQDVWGASPWTRELAAEVLQRQLDPHPPGTVRKPTTHEAGLRWMCLQYGPRLLQEFEACGSWEMVGRNIGQMIQDEQARAKRQRCGH